MANIPAYIRRKHGEEAVTYLHESLEPLRDTYGIFVYQEDIMTAAIAMADYTGPEADNLCYAIRKKKESVLASTRPSSRQPRRRHSAVRWTRCSPPSSRSRAMIQQAHATCYGLIMYQTAYLKANYLVEFMTAVLTASGSAAGKCGRGRRVPAAGIEMGGRRTSSASPRLNVEEDADGTSAIRFGISRDQERGRGAIEAVVAAREDARDLRHGRPFTTWTILLRMLTLHRPTSVVESLIKAGAMASPGSLGGCAAGPRPGDRGTPQRDVAAG